MKIIVLSGNNERIKSMIFMAFLLSKALVISSHNKTSNDESVACIMLILCLSPPDSVDTF